MNASAINTAHQPGDCPNTDVSCDVQPRSAPAMHPPKRVCVTPHQYLEWLHLRALCIHEMCHHREYMHRSMCCVLLHHHVYHAISYVVYCIPPRDALGATREGLVHLRYWYHIMLSMLLSGIYTTPSIYCCTTSAERMCCATHNTMCA